MIIQSGTHYWTVFLTPMIQSNDGDSSLSMLVSNEFQFILQEPHLQWMPFAMGLYLDVLRIS